MMMGSLSHKNLMSFYVYRLRSESIFLIPWHNLSNSLCIVDIFYMLSIGLGPSMFPNSPFRIPWANVVTSFIPPRLRRQQSEYDISLMRFSCEFIAFAISCVPSRKTYLCVFFVGTVQIDWCCHTNAHVVRNVLYVCIIPLRLCTHSKRTDAYGVTYT